MQEVFKSYISKLIESESALDYEWNSDNSEIVFKKKTADGFDVSVGYDRNYLYISTDRGYHNHSEAPSCFEDILSDVMGEARDLLSSNMRIREISSNGKPRKWILEQFVDGRWNRRHVIGLLFWNYLGRRSEKIYSNDTLPTRD